MGKKYFYERKMRKKICETGNLLYQKGFVSANDGNISCKLNELEYLCTPTNVSKGAMRPKMLLKIDKDGNVIKGKLKPSSEIKMHLRVYKENGGISAVVHAHPQIATTFAVAGVPLNKALTVEVVALLGVVPVAPYALPGTNEVPDSIAAFCREYNSVLLKNHGVLTWGKDIKEAYFRMELVENSAKLMMYSKSIFGEYKKLSNNQVDDLIKIRESIGIETGGRPEAEDEY